MLKHAALRVFVELQHLMARTEDEDGQTLAEYSLIISAIAVGTITIAVIVFRQALIGAWNSASSCLDGTC
jgi:Flp pilus assembly pilin Flp